MVIDFPALPVRSSGLPMTFSAFDEFDPSSDGLRYIHTPTWEHWFDDQKAKAEIRWVFNRRNWRLAFMQIRDKGSRDWVDGSPQEATEVAKDLTENDSRFLHDLEEWRLLESESLPSWTSTALKQDDLPVVPMEDLPLERNGCRVYCLSDYRCAPGSP